jgi:hypothetical protein
VYDYLLGGSHNFAADRAAAAKSTEAFPELPAIARMNRGFLRRAVRAVALEGVDQFIDLGAGIPTVGNVHEVARRVHPDAAVVYVDMDPIAVVHSRSILAGDRRSLVMQADLADTEAVLGGPEVAELVDFTRPVCVLLVAVGHFVTDTDRFADALKRYRDVAAPGSYLVLSHATGEAGGDQADRASQVYNRTTAPFVLRDRAEVAELLAGWLTVPPGIVGTAHWRPEPDADPVPDTISGSVLAVVARKE